MRLRNPFNRQKTKTLVATVGLLTVFVGGWYLGLRAQSKHFLLHNQFLNPWLTKDEIQGKIAKLKDDDIYHFRKSEVNLEGYDEPAILDYAFDPAIQSAAEDLMAHYKPDLGALVAIDAATGRILAMVGENRAFVMEGHPALSMSYPAASVFKVVTATAAIEGKKVDPMSEMEYAGRNHTLYRYQVLKERVTGWKRNCTLKEAFARSLNPVFGRLGVFLLGKEPLRSCSNRFAFNENIPSEFPVALSQSANPVDDFELAEMASGYTQDNRMTAVHGALIAATIANDGVMMEPYFLNAAYLKSGKPIYRSEPAIFSRVMTKDTSDELKNMMRETVSKGTGTKSFRGFFRGPMKELDVGGKTGSLTDKTLGGKIDWFIGYANSHGRKIAVSVMTMNKKYWVVKASYLARKTFETAFAVKKVAKR